MSEYASISVEEVARTRAAAEAEAIKVQTVAAGQVGGWEGVDRGALEQQQRQKGFYNTAGYLLMGWNNIYWPEWSGPDVRLIVLRV